MLWFLKYQMHFNSGIFMIQKEVADRIASEPRCKSYGRLTVRMQLSCHVDQFLFVPASAFLPPPKVDSAVIELAPQAKPLLRESEINQFEQFTSILFSARRKMLRKTITSAMHQLFSHAEQRDDEDSMSKKAEQTGILFTQRPEELSPRQILDLFRLLKGEH
jgi:16S rRNA (adenine1518-N6/adenine1519-N6)-dimethyltransferase